MMTSEDMQNEMSLINQNIEKLSRGGYEVLLFWFSLDDITPFGGHRHDIIKKHASVDR